MDVGGRRLMVCGRGDGMRAYPSEVGQRMKVGRGGCVYPPMCPIGPFHPAGAWHLQ